MPPSHYPNPHHREFRLAQRARQRERYAHWRAGNPDPQPRRLQADPQLIVHFQAQYQEYCTWPADKLKRHILILTNDLAAAVHAARTSDEPQA